MSTRARAKTDASLSVLSDQTTRWLSRYGVGLASADRLPVVVRIPAGPLGSLKCDPPKGNGRRPQKNQCPLRSACPEGLHGPSRHDESMCRKVVAVSMSDTPPAKRRVGMAHGRHHRPVKQSSQLPSHMPCRPLIA